MTSRIALPLDRFDSPISSHVPVSNDRENRNGERQDEDLDEDDESEVGEEWCDVREELEEKLGQMRSVGKFYAQFHNKKTISSLGLKVDGEEFSMPLQERDIQTIIGRGHESVLENSWTLDGSRIFCGHRAWPAELKKITATACNQLGMTEGVGAVEARLLKFSIHGVGAETTVPTNSEAAPRTFVTLVVRLPCVYTGGDLTVSFDGKRHKMVAAPTSKDRSTCIAWYADVLHTARPVTSGYCVALVYNLVVDGDLPLPSLPNPQNDVNRLKCALNKWKKTESPDFLVYPLQHAFHMDDISARQLKGSDHYRLQCMKNLHQELGLRLCMGILRTECGFVDDERDFYGSSEDGETNLTLLSVLNLDGRVVTQNVNVHQTWHIVESKDYHKRALNVHKHALDDYEAQHDTDRATHRYHDVVLVVILETVWVDFVLHPDSSCRFNDIRRFLEMEYRGVRAKPADEQAHAQCEKICEIAIKERVCKDPDSFDVVIECYKKLGRTDLIEQAIRNFPCRSARRLRALVFGLQADRCFDLAVLAIRTYQTRWTGADDFNAVQQLCKDIKREDLIEGAVIAHPCTDTASFDAIFHSCRNLNRISLVAGAIEKVGRSFEDFGGSFREQMLEKLSGHSAQFRFEEWRASLDVIFQTCTNITDCRNALNVLTKGWKYHNCQDYHEMNAWKLTCQERAIILSPALRDCDSNALKQIILEQGESWITDTLLPIAMKKNGNGSIAFSLSLWRLNKLNPAYLAPVIPTLSASTIAGISLEKPFVGSNPDPSTQKPSVTGRYVDYKPYDLFNFGLCLRKHPVARHGFLKKILEECKVESSSRYPQIGHLLLKFLPIMSDKHPEWYSDMVQAYVLGRSGFEPEKPENWTEARKLRCDKRDPKEECKVCRVVNKFLLDPKERIGRFGGTVASNLHLEMGLGFKGIALGNQSNHQYAVSTTEDCKLVIEKKFAAHGQQYAIWLKEAEATKKFVRSLGDEEHLRKVFGSRYDELANASLVYLRHTESGEPYRLPVVWAFDDEVQAKGATSLAPAAVPAEDSCVSPAVAGTKRKLPEDAATHTRLDKR